VQRGFPGSGINPARVVVDGDPANPRVRAALTRLRSGLAADPNYSGSRLTAHPGLAVLDVQLPGDPNGPPARRALQQLRSHHVAPAFRGTGINAYVTGATAFGVDYAALTGAWLPIVVGLVLTLTVLLLTVLFRSVVLPLKAALFNLLSVGAAYGLLVLIFQHGLATRPLGLQQVDTIEPWVPLFLFCVLFALSMDYHVFLLSRIRERYTTTGDTTDAVAHGIGSTGRIITGAALIMVVVFAGLATGDLAGLQQTGVGVAVALLLDATVVRSVIVPSSMALIGGWNWYLPRRLSWLPHLQAGTPHKPRPSPPDDPSETRLL
jgi:RND superfamily putative drug exporter